MYATDWVKPSDETWTAERLLNESRSSPVTKQKTNNTQQRVITLMCAASSDVTEVLRALQDDDEWCVNIENNTSPVQEGLDLFRGTITAQRFLRLTERDDGYYKTGITSF